MSSKHLINHCDTLFSYCFIDIGHVVSGADKGSTSSTITKAKPTHGAKSHSGK